MPEARAEDAHGPGGVEFIALMAMLSATVAFSIDAMLPALPEIAEALTPEAPNRAQLIVTSFVLGIGLGTFFVGPLSDRFGRKPVILCGGAIYVAGAALAAVAPALELVLAARVLQGLGAAAPRVVALAIIRDISSGRQMARLLSIVMLVFALFPAVAPMIGAGIITLAGWRGIFGAFILFAALSLTWLALRQPETLPPKARRALRPAAITAAVAEVFAHPTVRLSIAVQTLTFGMLFATLSSTQQVFDVTYGRGDSFPFWFFGIAVVAASASVLNARLVVRLGMRAMIKGMLGVQVGLSLGMVAAVLMPLGREVEFFVYLFWTTSVFFQMGLTLGNLNALGMEPLGHIAGMAASIIASVATVGAVLIAVPLGLTFDGTPLPLALGVAACAGLGFLLTRMIRRDTD